MPKKVMILSVEERLTRLEEQSYFQEQTLTELNQALTHQQGQLDDIEKRIILAEARITALLPLLEEGGKSSFPPHYDTVI